METFDRAGQAELKVILENLNRFNLCPDQKMTVQGEAVEVTRGFFERWFSITPWKKTKKVIPLLPSQDLYIVCLPTQRTITGHPDTLLRFQKFANDYNLQTVQPASISVH